MCIIPLILFCCVTLTGIFGIYPCSHPLQEDEILFLQNQILDEERISDQQLFSWEEELLKKYRITRDYLTEHYPSSDFKITSWDNQLYGDFGTVFFFSDTEDAERIYELIIQNENDCSYSIRGPFPEIPVKE